VLIEKWPFYLLTLASTVVTIVSQVRTAAMTPLSGASPARWLLQICYLVGFYLRKILWPVDLAPMYQPPASFSLASPVIVAGVVTTGILVLGAVLAARRAPAVPAAVCLFLLALSPTFLILHWSHVIAYDRYLYFPGLGPALLAGSALAWAWDAAATRGTAARMALVVLVLGVGGAETIGARSALAHWRDSVALWSHVVRVSPDELDARAQRGAALEARGDLDAATAEYRRILDHAPDYGPALISLGMLQIQRGRFDDAVQLFRHVCRLSPRDPNFAYQLGLAEKGAGHLDLAEARFRSVLDLRPDDVPARVQLGTVLVMTGKPDEGMRLVRQAVELAPSEPGPHFGLAMIQIHLHGPDAEAMGHLAEAVRLAPDWPLPAATLAWIQATSPDSAYRDAEAALKLAARAAELTLHRDPNVIDTYAAALAALGRFEQAATSAQAAVDLAARSGDSALADSARARLELYRRHTAYVDRSHTR
jgi:Flp pilus assembly protein TadD